MSDKVYVHCPSCGTGFVHRTDNTGKNVGGLGGAAAGATMGGKAGLFFGPLGAGAGAIIGGIIGGVAGKNIGDKMYCPRCPQCGVKFQLPSGL